MATPELCGLSISRAADLLATGEISAPELTEAYLERIEAVDPQINAYITVSADRAIDDAKRAAEEMQARLVHVLWVVLVLVCLLPTK